MKPHLFLAFREKSFVFLWIGEVLTQIAGNFFTIYLILTTFPLTRSNTAVSGVVLTFTIPAIFFGILAGAYVDHWNKKKVLITTNLFRAALILLLAFVHTNLFAIYSVSLLVSFFTQFFIPAETPIIPQIVRKEYLYSANALFALAINGSILVAYIFSGAVLLSFGPQVALIICFAMLVISTFSIAFVQYSEKKEDSISTTVRKLNIRKEIKSAFTLMAKTKKIYSSLFLLALVQTLVLIIASIAPGYATTVLHMNVDQFPLFFVTPAVLGMLFGAVILIHWFHNFAKNKVVTAGLILSGISMLTLPFGSLISSKAFVHTINAFLPHILMINSLHLLVFLAFILGLANSLIFVPSNTILQENTTDDNRGKLYGLLNAIVGICSLVPIIVVGGLSDLLGVSNVISAIGICLLLMGGYRFITYRRVE